MHLGTRRPDAGSFTRLVAVLGIAATLGAILSLVGLESRGSGMECGDDVIRVLDRLQWAILGFTVGALALGVVGSFARNRSARRLSIWSLVIALSIAAIMLNSTAGFPLLPIPEYLGAYVCSSGAA